MIRLSTIICAGVAAMSGLYLYHVKYQAQLLDRSIVQINQSIDATRDRTEVLKAEWTLLNDPERLAALAGQFLSLGTVAPKQFTALADLSSRLPAPRPMAPAPTATTDEPAEHPDGDAAEAVAELPLPLPPAAPEQPGPAVATASAAPTLTASVPSKPRAVEPVPRPRVASTTPSAPAKSPPAPLAPSASRHAARAASSAPARAVYSPPAHASAPGATVSALGMARSIAAPPVPIAAEPVGRPDLRGQIRYARGN